MYKKFFLKIDQYFFQRSFGNKDQIFFTQRLSLLLNSGISIVEAMKIISNIDIKSKIRQRVYKQIISDIERGSSLAKSIRDNDIRLNNVLVVLIDNGETSGRLPETLLLAFNFLERKEVVKTKMISAMIYPTFIIFATISMTLFLILYIFPKIIPLLKSLDIRLPLITRIVQFIYQLSVSYGLIIVSSIVMLYICLFLLINKNHTAKHFFHKIILKVPILNKYIKKYILSTFCNISEIMMSSGKTISDTAIFSSRYSKNYIYKNAFIKINDDLLRGIGFNESLKVHEDLFPSVFLSFISLGERTGNLISMIHHCGKIFEQDIENYHKRISSLIEPLLMIIMGLVVGTVALSIILPVYEITNHLNK